MYFFLILFFASLFAIVFMIGRKLVLVRNGQIISGEHSHPFVPDIHRIKHLTRESLKRYSYLTLVEIIRMYVRTVNWTKNKYKEWMIRIENMQRQSSKEINEQHEGNKFLKIISDYKNKVREIKHKITEEEENL